MAMTIDEAERLLSNHLDGVTNYCERELTDKAIKVAISTMRKDQKIKEYISIPNRYGTMAEDCQKLEYVRKVVEDGKID